MSSEDPNETNLFGWEMLFKINQKVIKTKYDVMICFAHWVMTRYGFQCGGVGDDTTMPKREELSELMPDGWNTEPPFKLRYVFGNQLYILSGLVDDDELIMNLSRPVDSRVLAMTIGDNQVTETHGSIEKIMPSYADIRKRIINELVEPLIKVEVTKDADTQTQSTTGAYPLEKLEKTNRSVHEMRMPPQPFNPAYPNVGQSDLLPPMLPGPNPFGVGGPGPGGIGGIGGGGGMLFEPPGFGPNLPFADPGMPRGMRPPGARYDPIRPPNPFRPPSAGPSRHNHPDHDHLPPPGYDDMFM